MSLLGDISIRLGLEVTDFQKGLQTAEKNMKNVGKNVSNIGKDLTKKVTLPLTALGGVAIKVGADWTESMAKVKAVTGATGDEFAELENLSRDLGKSTRYSANEVADAMGFLGMAGFETNEILESTEDVLNLASIGQLDLATTADIASNMLSGMGMSADEMGKIVDTMAHTMSNSNVDITGLGEAFKYVAPIASDMGVDLDELSASIGFLGDAGMQGGQAGRMLANGITRLASPSETASDIMKELGINVFNAEGELKSMPDVIKELEKGFEDLSPKERASAMKELFGQESAKGWIELMSKGSEELSEFSDEIKNAEGAGQNLADVMNDTFYASLDELKSILSEVGIQFFLMMEEPMRNIVDWTTKLVEKFSDLNEDTKKMILVGATVVAVIPVIIVAIGAVIKVIAFMVSTVSTIISVFKIVAVAIGAVGKAFALLSNPIGWITLAITAVIAVGVALWKNWETVREKTVEIWTAISEFFVELWQNILEVVTEFLESFTEWFSNAWESVKEFTVEVFTSIVDFLAEWGLMLYEATGLEAFVEFVISVWNFLYDTITITLEMILMVIYAIWLKVYDTVAPIVQDIYTMISDTFKKVFETVKTFTTNVLNTLKDIWNKISGVVKSVATGIWNEISKVWNNIWTTTKNIFNNVKSSISSVFNDIKSTISGIVGDVWSNTKKTFSKMTKAMTDPITKARDNIKKALDKIKSFFTGLKLKLPKPKMPSISVSRDNKKFMGVSVPVPKFSVNWNAKGNIFTGASLLGGGQGVGEAGAEVVMPIQRKRYMKPYASMVAELLDEKDSGNEGTGTIQNIFKIAELVVREDADVERIAKELERIQKKEQRAKGKLVY